MPLLVPYRLLLLLLLLGGLALGLDRLIVTDREAVEALVAEATRATREGDFEALDALLDADYAGKGGSRSGALRLVESLWRTWSPVRLESELGEIAVDGTAATAPLTVRAQVLGRPLRLELDTTYRKREDGWRVSGARVTGLGQEMGPGLGR